MFCSSLEIARFLLYNERMEFSDAIKEKLRLLPEKPGVYKMYDKKGEVIYVGKAKVLKNRVRQYFR